MRFSLKATDILINLGILLALLAVVTGCQAGGLGKPVPASPVAPATVASGVSDAGWTPGVNLAYGTYVAQFAADAAAGDCWWRIFATNAVKARTQSTNRGGAEKVTIHIKHGDTRFLTIGTCPAFVRTSGAES